MDKFEIFSQFAKYLANCFPEHSDGRNQISIAILYLVWRLIDSQRILRIPSWNISEMRASRAVVESASAVAKENHRTISLTLVISPRLN
jgi:hypothetical protein